MPVKMEHALILPVVCGDTISRPLAGFWGGYFDHSGLQADLSELLRDHSGTVFVLAPGGFSVGIAISSRVKAIISDREASTASRRLLWCPGMN